MCSSLFVLINDCPEEVCLFLTSQLNDAPRFKIHTRYLEGLLSLVSLVINSGTEGEVHVSLTPGITIAGSIPCSTSATLI